MSSLLKKILGVGAFKILAALTAFLFNVYLSRKLGSEQVGLFFLSLSIISALVIIVRLGLDNILLRGVAVFWSAEKKKDIKGLWFSTLFLVLASSILVTGILYFLSPWLSIEVFSKQDLQPSLEWMILGLPFFAIMFLTGFAFQAIGKPIYLIFLQNFSFQCILLIIIFSITEGSASQFSFYWFLSVAFIGISAFIIFTSLFYKVQANYPEIRNVLKPAMPLWWMQILTVLRHFGAPIYLGSMVSSSELAWFYASAKIAMLIAMILVTIDIIFAPKFAVLYQQNNIVSLESLAKKSVVVMLVLSLPISILIYVYADFFLGLFGDDFVAGADALRVMMFAQLINVATGSVTYLLMMSHHEKCVSKTATLNVVLTLVLGSILIPIWGIMGAAYATAIPLALGNLLNVYWVNKKLGFNTLIFWKISSPSIPIKQTTIL